LKQHAARLAVTLTAAYALILHLLFASALMASMPRGVEGICFGAQSAQTTPEQDRKTSRIHCPDCIFRNQLAPAPPAPQLSTRAAAKPIAHQPVIWRTAGYDAPRRAWQPRAPPISA